MSRPGHAGSTANLIPDPDAEVLDQRRGPRLVLGETPFGGSATDVGLDGVELGDAAQPLGRELRAGGVEDDTQLAIGMIPVMWKST